MNIWSKVVIIGGLLNRSIIPFHNIINGSIYPTNLFFETSTTAQWLAEVAIHLIHERLLKVIFGNVGTFIGWSKGDFLADFLYSRLSNKYFSH